MEGVNIDGIKKQFSATNSRHLQVKERHGRRFGKSELAAVHIQLTIEVLLRLIFGNCICDIWNLFLSYSKYHIWDIRLTLTMTKYKYENIKYESKYQNLKSTKYIRYDWPWAWRDTRMEDHPHTHSGCLTDYPAPAFLTVFMMKKKWCMTKLTRLAKSEESHTEVCLSPSTWENIFQIPGWLQLSRMLIKMTVRLMNLLRGALFYLSWSLIGLMMLIVSLVIVGEEKHWPGESCLPTTSQPRLDAKLRRQGSVSLGYSGGWLDPSPCSSSTSTSPKPASAPGCRRWTGRLCKRANHRSILSRTQNSDLSLFPHPTFWTVRSLSWTPQEPRHWGVRDE